MKLFVFVVLLSVGVFVNGQQPTTDFCDPSLCPAGVKQTACNNTGAFGPACPANAVVINLTTVMKQNITMRHNKHRHDIASGNMLPQFQPAIHMATMRWNAELATVALDNVITCVFAHDKCRATTQFLWSGQNIAMTWFSGSPPADILNAVLIPQVDAWWAEYANAYQAELDSCPASANATIGHFTVMTAEKNTALGCGVVQFTDPAQQNKTFIIMACNYARTNIISLPLYRKGPTASLCTTGTNPNFPALCSLSEPYNVNAA